MRSLSDISREDIENLRYLKNPRTAAVYLGVPQIMVEDVWAEMPEPRQFHGGAANPTDSHGAKAASESRRKAEEGSERLKSELLQSMLRWGVSTGSTPEQTVGFLLYGRSA